MIHTFLTKVCFKMRLARKLIVADSDRWEGRVRGEDAGGVGWGEYMEYMACSPKSSLISGPL